MNPVHRAEEYLDLVDEHDNVIGKKLRDEVHAQNLSNFRVVNLFIKNSHGQLWVRRRAAHKRNRPLALDMSMGGHVDSGETYEEAFKRETKEELNIDVDTVEVRFCGYLTPHLDGVGAFMKVYEIRQDEAPDYSPDDFVEYFWLSPQELLALITQGEQIKYDMPVIVKKFFI